MLTRRAVNLGILATAGLAARGTQVAAAELKTIDHNSRTNLRPRLCMADFAVLDGFEGHNSVLPITSLGSPARMASLAMIACNRRESRLFHAGMGRRRRAIGRRPR